MSDEAQVTPEESTDTPAAPVETPPAAAAEPPAGEPATEAGGTVASGATDIEPDAPATYWPDDWRDKVADHVSAGNEKERTVALNELERVNDPSGLASRYIELRRTLSSGDLIKKPDPENSEEVDAFYKTMGFPEKPEDYYDHIKLDNGAVIGDAEKPIYDGLFDAVHGAVTPVEALNRAVNYYNGVQENSLAEMDKFHDDFKRSSIQELKSEWGPAYERNINSIAPMFANAPGGSDLKNGESFINNFLGGTMADGTRIGDNPHMLRLLVEWGKDVNPEASVTGGVGESAKSVNDEIKEIEKTMRTDRRAYDKDEVIQARYRELLDAQIRMQAKKAA